MTKMLPTLSDSSNSHASRVASMRATTVGSFQPGRMAGTPPPDAQVYLDAPNPASGQIPRDVAPFFEGPYYEWLKVEEIGDRLEFDLGMLDRSVATICRVLREQGPFDGMVGFSQGAIMTSSIVALQAAGMLLQDIPRIKFCVLFAGMPTRFPDHAQAFASKVAVPSLHCFGDKDYLRPHCVRLADHFANAVVVHHTRGHVIPPLNDLQLAVFRAFLSSFLPGSGGSEVGAPGQHHAFIRHPPSDLPTPHTITDADYPEGKQRPLQGKSSTAVGQHQASGQPAVLHDGPGDGAVAAADAAAGQPAASGYPIPLMQLVAGEGTAGSVPETALNSDVAARAKKQVAALEVAAASSSQPEVPLKPQLPPPTLSML